MTYTGGLRVREKMSIWKLLGGLIMKGNKVIFGRVRLRSYVGIEEGGILTPPLLDYPVNKQK